MDFFKFIFSENPNQPQNDDAPELNLDPNPNPDPDSDSTVIWSFGGLIKMIASKSDRVARCHGFLGFARRRRFHPSGIVRVGRSSHRLGFMFGLGFCVRTWVFRVL
nr:hypothetical protein CFP56_51747 [Quercus suber]